MFNSSDYQVSYAVGDDHPSGGTAGIKAEEAVVTGEGTYTVSLDFTETAGKYATSFVFAAIGIYNGEKLFPGYIIDIQELVINGEKVDIKDNGIQQQMIRNVQDLTFIMDGLAVFLMQQELLMEIRHQLILQV